MDMERELIAYAGQGYAKPQTIEVDSAFLCIVLHGATPDQAIDFLAAFRDRHPGCKCEITRHDYDGGASLEIVAARLETEAETEARIETYRQYVRAQQDRRRQEFNRMKIEFGE